ncbi:MAG: response regulator [Candidatus Omnitrophica bacterium]|nr:response regulator [Candidatus Omnitrophota bacterium]
MPHKILLVDDDRVNTALIKFGLAEHGYTIITAADGEQGLASVEKDKPDLIVLDVLMPKMNGFEFMNELKRMQGFDITPVIMLTANETMEDVFRLEGVKGYFVKPINDLNALQQKIVQCLGPNQ